MAVLAEGQYELSYLGKSILFGRRTGIEVGDLELGDPAVETGDYRNPRADGIGFGRDTKGGRLLTWDGNILARASRQQRAEGITSQRIALDLLNRLETFWDAEEIRLNPDTNAVLRWRRGGLQRRVYGRPRRFTPTPGNTYQGWIPFVMDFQTRTADYYDDLEQVAQISMVPDAVGGLIGNRVGPWVAATGGAGKDVVDVGGYKPAWLNFRIRGPISGALINPYIEVVGQWAFQLQGEIRYDEFVSVVSNPWERAIRRSDGSNWAGRLTTVSRSPSGMRVPVGPQTVLLKGNDATLTSRVEVYWRDVQGSYA